MKRRICKWLIAGAVILLIVFVLSIFEVRCFGCLLARHPNRRAYYRGAEVHVCVNNFPDKNFRRFIRDTWCTDGSNVLSDALLDSVTEMDCSGLGLKSLEGIELFTRLIKLDCSQNDLTKLSVSSITNLEELDCSDNRIVEIYATSNRHLVSVNCARNKLEALSVSNCRKLQVLDCSDNALNSLFVVDLLSPLTYLDCRNNNLKFISSNITNGTGTYHLSPQYIELAYNPVDGLDITEELGNPEEILSIVTADGTSCEITNTVFFPESTDGNITITTKVYQQQDQWIPMESIATLSCKHSYPDAFFLLSANCIHCAAQKLNYTFIAICAVSVLIAFWFIRKREKFDISCEIAEPEPEEE